MHIEIGNLRERVRRGCAWSKIYDMKIIKVKTWIFRIVNVQILNKRQRVPRGGGWLGFLLKKI